MIIDKLLKQNLLLRIITHVNDFKYRVGGQPFYNFKWVLLHAFIYFTDFAYFEYFYIVTKYFWILHNFTSTLQAFVNLWILFYIFILNIITDPYLVKKTLIWSQLLYENYC